MYISAPSNIFVGGARYFYFAPPAVLSVMFISAPVTAFGFKVARFHIVLSAILSFEWCPAYWNHTHRSGSHLIFLWWLAPRYKIICMGFLYFWRHWHAFCFICSMATRSSKIPCMLLAPCFGCSMATRSSKILAQCCGPPLGLFFKSFPVYPRAVLVIIVASAAPRVLKSKI